MSVWAWICGNCKHRVAQHRATQDATTVEGPYACLYCDCQIDQHAPQFSVTQAEYERTYRPQERPQTVANHPDQTG